MIVNKSKEFPDIIVLELSQANVNNRFLKIVLLYRSQKCGYSLFIDELDDILIDISGDQCAFVDFNVDLLSKDYNCNTLKHKFNAYGWRSCHELFTRSVSKTSVDCVFGNVYRLYFLLKMISQIIISYVIVWDLLVGIKSRFRKHGILLNTPNSVQYLIMN